VSKLKILVYKRTHVGDPNGSGQFGIHGCMGAVRGRHYDAVIGVGGIGSEAQSYGISGRINWVGIGPTKDWGPLAQSIDSRGPLVQFDKFRLWEDKGPLLQVEAPLLARRFYEKKARWVLDGLSRQEYEEALAILKLVDELEVARLVDNSSRPCAGRYPGNSLGDVTEPVVHPCPPIKTVADPTLVGGICTTRCSSALYRMKKNC
jgi:hypothetical protein